MARILLRLPQVLLLSSNDWSSDLGSKEEIGEGLSAVGTGNKMLLTVHSSRRYTIGRSPLDPFSGVKLVKQTV